MSARANPFFSPTQISGCQLWLDGADPNGTGIQPANTAAVNTWVDKSGNANNAIGGGGPIWTSSDRALNFNGSTQYYTFTNPTTLAVNKAFIFFVVEKRGAFVSQGAFVAGSSSGFNSNLMLQYNQNTLVNLDFYGTGEYRTAVPAFQGANEPTRLWTAVYTQSQRYVFLNGLQQGASYNAGGSTPNANNNFSQNVVSWTGGGLARIYNSIYYTGKIYEVAWYTSLTDPQRQQVEGYLAWKWGLQGSLPANHPYKTSIIPPLLSPPLSLPALTQNPQGFLPTQISGCQLWLDAADTSTQILSGSSVIQWNDKSGNGFNPTTYSGTITRTTRNGVPALNFGSSVMKVSSYSWPSYNSIFIVASSAVAQFLFVQSRNDNEYLSFLFTGNWVLYQGFDNTSKLTLNDSVIAQGTPVVSANQFFLLSFGYNGGTASSFYSINGTSRATVYVSGPALSNTTTTSQPLYINGRWSGAFDSSIVCEIIQYRGSVSTAQQQQIEGYLAWKWGLVANLPASHPYKSFPPFTPTVGFPARSLVQTATWTPLRISGCQLWLDAADSSSLLVSGSNVTQWNDKSGTGTNASVSSNAFAVLSNSGLYFSNSYYTTSYSASLPNESFFTVFQTTTALTSNGIVGATPGTGGRVLLISHSGFTDQFGMNASGVYAGAGVKGITANTRFLGVYQMANGTSTQVSLNGGSLTAPVVIPGLTAGRTTTLGREFAATQPFVGFLYETIAYNSYLSQSQRQQVEGYLAWKWGLQGSLPATHPFKLWPPPP